MSRRTKARRAIGIIRVSQVGGREGESFASPAEQRDRIQAACERDGLKLVDVFEELDVSGGKPLDQRPGLGLAVHHVESGDADVIVAAYFDRLVRSLRVQDELVSRVEHAGGQVLAVEVGRVTNGSAGQWLSGTMLGAVSEYQRRTAAERSREAQIRAVGRGVLPWPNVTPGYVVGEDSRLVPDPKTRRTVVRAFELRDGGATVAEVRDHLRRHGIERSYHGTSALLKSRVVLGEIHLGDLVNLQAHEPIVDRELWQRVQRRKVSRGRRAKSERLLARLGVLRCASCGSRMVVGTANRSAYFLYRCPPTGDCSRRVTISAELVETVVADHVRAALSDAEGRASAETNVRESEDALARAQADLDAAIRTFAGFEDEDATRQRIVELRQSRDNARDRLEDLGGTRAAVTVNAGADWERLTLDERRALIRATVESATVAPGRGAERVSVHLFGQ